MAVQILRCQSERIVLLVTHVSFSGTLLASKTVTRRSRPSVRPTRSGSTFQNLPVSSLLRLIEDGKLNNVKGDLCMCRSYGTLAKEQHMMLSRMGFPVDETHHTQEELQAIHTQRHHTPIINLAELQNRTHLMSSLPSGGQSVNMSKPQSLK